MSLNEKLVEILLYEGKSRIDRKGRKRWSEQIVWDDEVPGLGLKISHTNRKSFVVTYRSRGRKRRKTLGTTSALTLAEARRRAADLLASSDDEPKRAAVPTPAFRTVGELAAAWIEQLKKRKNRVLAEQRLVRAHLQPAMGRTPVAEISRGEISSLKSRVRRQFPRDGARFSKLLDELFAWAGEQGAWATGRPARAAIARAAREAGDVAPAAEPEPPPAAGKEAAGAAEEEAGEPEQLEERLQEASALGARMMASLSEQAASRQRLERELTSLRHELDEARRQPDRARLQEAERVAANLSQTVEQLMDSLKRSQAEGEDLAARLEGAEEAREDESRKLAAVAAERNRLEDRLRAAEGRLAQGARRTFAGRGGLVAAGAAAGILLMLLLTQRAGPPVDSPPERAAATPPAGTSETAAPAVERAQAPAVSSPAAASGEPPDAAAVAGPEEAEPPAAEPAAEEAPPPAEPATEPPDPAAVEPAVRSWAAAWSEQRVPDYLAAYAGSFTPPRGLDRREWEAERRARILRPDWIRLELGPLERTELAPDRVRVAFDQSYTTESYSDRVWKVLELVWEEGSWMIASERSE